MVQSEIMKDEMSDRTMEPATQYRKTWAEINLDAIYSNVSSFRKALSLEKQIMAVVKANGYGHGAIPVAKEALAAGATWLGVAYLKEALQLREAGISAPILLFGYLPEEYVPIAQKNNISISINDFTTYCALYDAVEQGIPPAKFHLKIDTGMSRLGFTEETELLQVIRDYSSHKVTENAHEGTTIGQHASLVEWEGIYTHLATADEEEGTYFQGQVTAFTHILKLIRSHGLEIPYIHMANSAGIIRLPEFPDTNLVRLGISMYGLYPSPQMKEDFPFSLQPAFSLHSYFSLVKKIKPKTGVSYGITYMSDEEEWLGTIPIGYADGWSRRLSNQADALVDGRRMKIVGRICMDQCMIQLDQGYSKEEKVTLIGKQAGNEISIDEVAQLLNTINYEITCMIGYRVPRVYVKDGKRLE
jgi:alanine racemase